MELGKEESGKLLEMALGLCEEVRDAVRPHLGRPDSKGLAGTGASGDATFSIDEIAEEVVESHLEKAGDIASYTEDRGLVAYGNPGHVLIIDPIDGTRPAAAGLEACCVSIAIAPYSPGAEESLTLGDVCVGVVSEIKNRAVYSAVRGGGARIELDGTVVQPALSDKETLETIFWTLGFRGRPAEPLITVLSELIDTSSVGGGQLSSVVSANPVLHRKVIGKIESGIDRLNRKYS